MIGPTNALRTVAKSSQVSLIPAVSCGINEKFIIFMADHESNSTALTQIASDIVARDFHVRRI
jgi:hypothetical protein